MNKEIDLNFNDYINRYRIEYCLEKLGSGEFKHLTVEGIGFRLGFGSRTTFTNAFKKATGMTPNQYRNRNAGD